MDLTKRIETLIAADRKWREAATAKSHDAFKAAMAECNALIASIGPSAECAVAGTRKPFDTARPTH